MGADAHAYIEYVATTRPDGSDYWQPFGGQIRLDPHYSLFGLLANVRCDGAIFAPRGLPDDLAYEAEGDSRLRIVEDDDPAANAEGCTTRSRANEWVQHGEKTITVGSSEYVTHPDWHSHTWLTPGEFRQVLQAQEEAAAREDVGLPGARYYAAAAALEALEDEGRGKARIILWFDN